MESFTKTLIRELSHAVQPGQPNQMTVLELHQRLSNHPGARDLDVLSCPDNRTQISHGNHMKTPPDRKYTSTRVVLTGGEKPPSIILSPLKEPGVVAFRHCGYDGEEIVGEWPKVLISVCIQHIHSLSEGLLQQWLASAPVGVVEFLGLYDSFPAMLLFRIPEEIWDLLPPCSAVAFICFVEDDKSIHQLMSYRKLPRLLDETPPRQDTAPTVEWEASTREIMKAVDRVLHDIVDHLAWVKEPINVEAWLFNEFCQILRTTPNHPINFWLAIYADKVFRLSNSS